MSLSRIVMLTAAIAVVVAVVALARTSWRSQAEIEANGAAYTFTGAAPQTRVSLDGATVNNGTLIEQSWNWSCIALWYQQCSASREFKIERAGYTYCKHSIVDRSVNREVDKLQVTVLGNGISAYRRVSGSLNPFDQQRGWFDSEVTVSVLPPDSPARSAHGCVNAPPLPTVRFDNVCKNTRIPNGWIQIGDEYDSRCGGTSRRKNRWRIVKYDELQVTAELTTCIAAAVPAGWQTVREYFSLVGCGDPSASNPVPNMRRIRRVS